MSDTFKYDVFISHTSEDRVWAKTLADKLEKLDFLPCVKEIDLDLDETGVKRMIDALEDSATFAFLYGKNYHLRRQDHPLFSALEKRSIRARGEFRIIQVFLPGADHVYLMSSPARSEIKHGDWRPTSWVKFDRTLDEEANFQQFILQIRGFAPDKESVWSQTSFLDFVRQRASNLSNVDWKTCVAALQPGVITNEETWAGKSPLALWLTRGESPEGLSGLILGELTETAVSEQLDLYAAARQWKDSALPKDMKPVLLLEPSGTMSEPDVVTSPPEATRVALTTNEWLAGTGKCESILLLAMLAHRNTCAIENTIWEKMARWIPYEYSPLRAIAESYIHLGDQEKEPEQPEGFDYLKWYYGAVLPDVGRQFSITVHGDAGSGKSSMSESILGDRSPFELIPMSPWYELNSLLEYSLSLFTGNHESIQHFYQLRRQEAVVRQTRNYAVHGVTFNPSHTQLSIKRHFWDNSPFLGHRWSGPADTSDLYAKYLSDEHAPTSPSSDSEATVAAYAALLSYKITAIFLLDTCHIDSKRGVFECTARFLRSENEDQGIAEKDMFGSSHSDIDHVERQLFACLEKLLNRR